MELGGINLAQMLIPGQTIGIIGGGEVGRMLSIAAKSMGFQVGILDPTPNAPAAQTADWQIIAELNNEEALQKLVRRSDVMTYECDNFDGDTIRTLEEVPLFWPDLDFLPIIQDRLLEKNFLEVNNLNIAPYATIVLVSDIRDSVNSIGFPCVLKTTRNVRNPEDQHIMNSLEDIKGCVPLIQRGPCVLEAWIPNAREISVTVARNQRGEICVFPPVQNLYRKHILHQSFTVTDLEPEVIAEIDRIARLIAEEIHLCGTLGIELFLDENGTLYVKELTPPLPNSGYYTIEACTLSQFEAHLRGICNWPLPEKAELLKPAIMTNVLGEHVAETFTYIGEKPDWHFHFYGETVSSLGRKMGHVTVLTEDVSETLAEIKETKIWDY